MLEELKRRAAALKADSYALYLVARRPGTPWYARLLVAAVAAYALSPIDLIPDFIPVLGYLDDLVIVPAGIALAIRLVPDDVLAECRARAAEVSADKRPGGLIVGAIVVGMWILVAVVLGVWVLKVVNGR